MSCCAHGCRNRYGERPGLGFFRFPMQHGERKKRLCVAKENLWLNSQWDVALEHGLDGSMALLKPLSLTLFRDRQCPMSNCAHTVPQDSPLCEHLFECHTDLDPSVTPAFVIDNIISSTSNPEHFLIPLGLSLLKVLPL